MIILWSVATTFCLVTLQVNAQPAHLPPQLHSKFEKLSNKRTASVDLGSSGRTKRNSNNLITDHDNNFVTMETLKPQLEIECIHMTSDEGDFYRKSSSDQEGVVCGVYIFAEPDQKIEVHFNYMDVPCNQGGLVSFVDGWELNGQFFPNVEDHPKAMNDRFAEFCGQRKVKKSFVSSQNVALIQYRMTAKASFSFSVRFHENPKPCNVLVQDFGDLYTLRNYGKRSNCSISALFPAAVRVVAVNVGMVPSPIAAPSLIDAGFTFEIETGTLHKCHKRGLDDYVQIGGSAGLDNSGLLLADSVCGLDSRAAKHWELIGCGTTTIRMVSSGDYDNSITLAIRQMTEQDIAAYISVVCPPEVYTQ